MTVIRPNGKPYKPRKAPVIQRCDDHYGFEIVAVLRTHDISQAVVLATQEIHELCLTPSKAYTTWWREVPWDPSGLYDRGWVYDPVRGMPCVVIPYD